LHSVTALRRVAGQPTWLVGQSYARAQALLAAAFTAEGLRGYHFRVLAALDQFGASSQAALGRRTGIDRSDVVSTLDDLVARGWARRRPDPTDGRRNVVTITRRGTATLERLDRVVTGVQDTFLTRLTPSERMVLVRLLGKLTQGEEIARPGTST
jgi:DNA-binding MarR family transcriptional regulator